MSYRSDQSMAAVYGVMIACPRHLFVVVTQGSLDWYWTFDGAEPEAEICLRAAEEKMGRVLVPGSHYRWMWPPKNVWVALTETRGNQLWAARNLLLRPAAKRILIVRPGPLMLPRAITPLSGSVGCTTCGKTSISQEEAKKACCFSCSTPLDGRRLDWVICSPHGSPFSPDALEQVRQLTASIGAAFYFSSWGGWSVVYDAYKDMPSGRPPPNTGEGVEIAFADGSTSTYPPQNYHKNYHYMKRIGASAGRLLNGREYNEIPEEPPLE